MRALFAAALLIPVLAGTATAQMRQPQILTLGGGVSQYSLGTDKGTTWVIVARFDGNVGPYVIIEPGFSFMRFSGQFGERNWLLPDLSLQFQGYVGPVRPYLGGGIGFANISTGPSQSQFTLHAASGVRVRLGNGWGVRAEARARAIDPFHNHTFDFTAGIMRVLPGSF